MSMPCRVEGCPRRSLSGYCFIHKPKKPLQRVKRMRKVGKIGKKLLDLRKEYLKAYPAPHYCYYCLYVGIEEELPEDVVQIEHYYSRNKHPDLRFDWSNLVKSCPMHNQMKGNMDGDEFLELLGKGELCQEPKPAAKQPPEPTD
jgi:hypothetical protein